MLHDLRRRLDEVELDPGPRRVEHLGQLEPGLEHVPELVEQGRDISVLEQRLRVAMRGGGKVRHQIQHRRPAVRARAVRPGFERGHPAAGALALAHEGVDIAVGDALAGGDVAQDEEADVRVPGPNRSDPPSPRRRNTCLTMPNRPPSTASSGRWAESWDESRPIARRCRSWQWNQSHAWSSSSKPSGREEVPHHRPLICCNGHERREDPIEERLDGVRAAGHPRLVGELAPRRRTHQRGDPAPQCKVCPRGLAGSRRLRGSGTFGAPPRGDHAGWTARGTAGPSTRRSAATWSPPSNLPAS